MRGSFYTRTLRPFSTGMSDPTASSDDNDPEQNAAKEREPEQLAPLPAPNFISRLQPIPGSCLKAGFKIFQAIPSARANPYKGLTAVRIEGQKEMTMGPGTSQPSPPA